LKVASESKFFASVSLQPEYEHMLETGTVTNDA